MPQVNEPFEPAATPRKIWVELTSKCPFDCIFCSRKTLRASGEHMPFALFESLVRQTKDPRAFLLNYSGESTVYPDLIPAIWLARSTGAFVELVSALGCATESLLEDLSRSGLNRLTVSLHAASAAKYQEIYRYSSFETLRARLVRFLELCGEVPQPPIVDLAFVAMDRNLDELAAVAALAESLNLREITIFPVIRRDEIPIQFPEELEANGTHRHEFRTRLRDTLESTRTAFPGVSLTVSNPAFAAGHACLGEVPREFPGLLPAEARIHSCEQNPWETAHVLSNGDVVVCEVLDKIPLGNLTRQSLAEIWHGEAYRQFRERYHPGAVVQCRSCPWKRAYIPGPMRSEVIASRGRSAQLRHGWHDPSGEPHVWSSQQAAACLLPKPSSCTLHVSGILPPGPAGDPNQLTIRCGGKEIGEVVNPWAEMMPFGLDFPVPESGTRPWSLQFRTRHVFRPVERGWGPDQRDLGFALVLLGSQRARDPEREHRRQRSLRPLLSWIRTVDGVGSEIGRYYRRTPRADSNWQWSPGISIIIPERDNPNELHDCLASVRRATAHRAEPSEVIVIVNGSSACDYRGLQANWPEVHWRFHRRPLGFSAAIAAGLRRARYDWVYLLNNDAVLEPGALEQAALGRSAATFAVASQILLKDTTCFRDETNWTALFLEDGLATTHDRIPQSGVAAESFYAGGGASLFQTRVLRAFLDVPAYEPFYWEDVEWGWRARKLGYHVVFCAPSIVHHRKRATIRRHYSEAEIEAVIERNRLLFQLRNFTTVGSLKRVFEEISRSSETVAQWFLTPCAFARIARGRLWNHAASVADEKVLINS